jgi:hypothetical protein
MDETKLLTSAEVAQILDLTPGRVRALIVEGKLTGGVIRGGSWFFKPETIKEFQRTRKTRRKIKQQ